MKKIIISLIILASAQVFAGGGSSIGPANPAALNCVRLGGELESVNTKKGTYSNCVIQEWTLFRAMYERGLVKDHQYGPGAMPNPAAVNCTDIGGSLRYISQNSACVVEEWTLFRVINVL